MISLEFTWVPFTSFDVWDDCLAIQQRLAVSERGRVTTDRSDMYSDTRLEK